GKFLDGTFAGEYQESLIAEFNSYLPDVVPWETISGTKTVPMPRVK
ncbi:MAG: HAD family hydrolase, partial [Propioniciclava sp.]|nr:HAD family hydrolase [Propioniciclava sp.]